MVRVVLLCLQKTMRSESKRSKLAVRNSEVEANLAAARVALRAIQVQNEDRNGELRAEVLFKKSAVTMLERELSEVRLWPRGCARRSGWHAHRSSVCFAAICVALDSHELSIDTLACLVILFVWATAGKATGAGGCTGGGRQLEAGDGC